MPTTMTAQGGQEGGGGGGSTKCQDCGNQAKKECSYSRCRTCCKNKGFNCQTHIKSTWIPVDRRRHRDHDHPSLFHGDTSKRHKPNSFSGAEELKFPAATNSMAIFRCVQVRSMDDTVNEIAYQTSVNIGGHVFSGLLYDQGPVAAPPQSSIYATTTAKGDTSTAPTLDQQHNNNNLCVLNTASTQTHHHDEGAVMAPLLSSSSASAAPHDEPNFLPPPYPFPLTSLRPPGMPYFSYPKP